MADGKSFDLEAVYDAEIFPLMSKIIEVCKKHHLPMIASFLYKSDPEGIGDGEDKYCSTFIRFDDHESADEMDHAMRIIDGTVPLRPSFKITTRNAAGEVTGQSVIL